MVEAVAVAGGTNGRNTTITTFALGMALAAEHDVTVVNSDTEIVSQLLPAEPVETEGTLREVLLDGASIEAASYDQLGMRVVPCDTSLTEFEAADPDRLHEVFAKLARESDILLLDAPPVLTSERIVLPVIMAHRMIVTLEPTLQALSDAIKVGEYATVYESGIAGVLFTNVDERPTEQVRRRADRYFDAPVLGEIPADSFIRDGLDPGTPSLNQPPDSNAAEAYRSATEKLSIQNRDADAFAQQAKRALQPQRPR